MGEEKYQLQAAEVKIGMLDRSVQLLIGMAATERRLLDEARREVALLREANQQLHAQVSELHDRLFAQVENLRSTPCTRLAGAPEGVDGGEDANISVKRWED